MTTLNFASQVAEWVKSTKGAVEAVFHESTQRVVDEMQKPGPSKASTGMAIAKGAGLGKKGRNSKKAYGPVKPPNLGGNIPVDIGYLWHSLAASTTEMPQIRNDAKGVDGKSYSYNAGPVNLIINSAGLGKTIYLGYTASYAAKVNYSYGYLFVELAAQKWPTIVAQVEAELGQRMGR